MRHGLLGGSLRIFCGHDSLEWQDPEAEADCYLDLATTDDNQGALYLRGRLIDADPASSSTHQIIRTWLRECDMHHVQCRPPSQLVLPTRLVDVGTDNNSRVKLIHTRCGELQNYVALSYCWGTAQTLATTRENLATYKDEIPFERLPKTIKDAITITRDLGIQFLWVDVLCIVQDSLDGEDWQRESAKMGDIYGNAYVTIAAENSESCNDGFLHERNQARAAPLQEIPLHLPNGELRGSVFICAPIVDEDCFLMRRAWAFQEQRLSRRVLHYRTGGLNLCCREGTWFESVALSFGNTLEHQHFNAIRPVSISSRSQTENHRDWLRSIEVYSSRSMTKASDKLPAISGYAHEVHKSVGGLYLAGIWERYLAFGLLWVANKDENSIPQASRERAPSWSWAAIDGRVSYYWPLSRIKEESLLGPHLNLVSHQINLNGLDPMGEVVEGALTVSGYLKKVSWLPPPSRSSGVSITSSDTWYRFPEFEWGKCLFDCHNAEMPDNLWCLVVIMEMKSANCLVLDHAGCEGKYRRVGLARLRRVTDMQALLSSFDVSTITIV
ncbi:hypothetical protein G7Y89_g5799 [Cudoniella acicularis]|uniref:Heterokaryon incompatibility domain-containing protein n=1 Tax=Cudoniella acicularis TaxID=354080 RepID=A0A8H4RP36_9HELO|nr:hypothetical protein G7Y89_g5799 [Cudoniella acicularis]